LRYFASVSAGLLLFAPWLIWSFAPANRPDVGTSWIEDVWSQTPKLLAIPRSLEIFGLGSEAELIPMWMHQFSAIDFPPALRFLGLLALLACPVTVATPRGDANLGIARMALRKTSLAALVLGPLLMLWLISWAKPLYAIGRYDFLAYPAFLLLVGLAFGKLERSQGGIAAAILAAALLIPVTAKIYFYYQAPETAKPRLTARFMDTEVRNGDVVVFTGLRALPVLYYLDRLGYTWENGFCRNLRGGRSFYCRMYPRIAEKTPAAEPSQLPGSAEAARIELADYLAKIDSQKGTFWVVLSGVMPLRAIRFCCRSY